MQLMSDKSAPAVKFPPPLLYLGMILLGVGLDNFLKIPAISLPFEVLIPGGIILFLIGLAVNVAGLLQFKKQQENPLPWTGSEQMIGEGIYRITRNPMYLGMTCIGLGVGLFFNSYAILATVLLGSVIIDRLVIAREEEYLTDRFGESYTAYKSKVRRWL